MEIRLSAIHEDSCLAKGRMSICVIATNTAETCYILLVFTYFSCTFCLPYVKLNGMHFHIIAKIMRQTYLNDLNTIHLLLSQNMWTALVKEAIFVG